LISFVDFEIVVSIRSEVVIKNERIRKDSAKVRKIIDPKIGLVCGVLAEV